MAYQQRMPAQRYPACDSYFVEEDSAYEEDSPCSVRNYKDDPWTARAMQEDIQLELSVLADREYRADILQHMEDMEVRKTGNGHLVVNADFCTGSDTSRCCKHRTPD